MDTSGTLEALIEQLKAGGHIRSSAVEMAFRRLPRQLFAPDVPPEQVYSDQSVPIRDEAGQRLTVISQPSVMARMLEYLELEPGQKVLEVGTGSGFFAGLLGSIVGPQGHVVTLEIEPALIERAAVRLSSAGIKNVEVVSGDGGYGYSPAAPFDRIVSTAGVGEITPEWLKQLKPHGCLLVPLDVGMTGETLVALKWDGSHLVGQALELLHFVPLRGAYEALSSLSPDPQERLSALEREANDVSGVTIRVYPQDPSDEVKRRLTILMGRHSRVEVERRTP